MIVPIVSLELFEELLPKICDGETSYDPKMWTTDNPLKDHCAIVTLVANNLFGGQIMRAKMENSDSHYWNRLPDGMEKDFTRAQFGNSYPTLIKPTACERSYVLSPKFPNTIRRYKLLAYRLIMAIENNPLYRDPIYEKCIMNAFESPCQKMKFGCVLRYYHDCERVGAAYWEEIEACNEPIKPLKSLCEPTCIRFNIPSRTESMIGACGHAEEWALWKAAKRLIPIDDSELYIAGLYGNCLPYIKKEAEFTCLRCAVPIYQSGIKKVWVPVVDHWESLTGEECVKIAKDYALKLKAV